MDMGVCRWWMGRGEQLIMDKLKFETEEHKLTFSLGIGKGKKQEKVSVHIPVGMSEEERKHFIDMVWGEWAMKVERGGY